MESVDSDIEKLLLTIAEDRRREYGDRIWRTVEYFTVVLSAILSVSIGLFIELSKINNVNGGYAFLILLFILGVFISVTAWFNVRREYQHQLEAIAEKAKAEWSLGLAKKVVPAGQRMFPKDDHILLERYCLKNTFEKDEEWVKNKMKIWQNRQAALIWFGTVFWGFAFVFTVAITLIIYLAYPTIALQINAYWVPLIIFAIVGVLCYLEHRNHTRIAKARTERLESIKQATAKLDDHFFSNRFDRPLGMLTKATIELRQTVGKIDDTLRLEHKETQLTQESDKNEF